MAIGNFFQVNHKLLDKDASYNFLIWRLMLTAIIMILKLDTFKCRNL